MFLKGAKPLVNINQVLIDLKLVSTQTEITFKDSFDHQTIPNEYLKYYSFIKQNSPCSMELILNNFNEDFVGNIISTLTFMELNNYIKLSDKGYYVQ